MKSSQERARRAEPDVEECNRSRDRVSESERDRERERATRARQTEGGREGGRDRERERERESFNRKQCASEWESKGRRDEGLECGV